MNILITGSAGFVGRTLVPMLTSQGHTVVGIDLNAESQSTIPLQADLRKITSLPIPQIDLAIHLASDVGGFLHNFSNETIESYELELLKSLKNICEAHHCQRVLYTSSINVFEKSRDYTFGPLGDTQQHSSYGQAKKRGEEFIQSHFDQFIIIRPTNIFGREQILLSNSSVGRCHVIPELLKKIEQSETIEILGDGSQVRNFIHVTDVCRFILQGMESPMRGWFNLRSDIHLTIKELACELLAIRGVKKSLIYQSQFMKYEPEPLGKFDINEALRTGWQAEVKSIREGLSF